MQTVAGLPTARGLATGPVFLYRGSGGFAVPEYVVPPEKTGEELAKLKRARAVLKRDIENLIAIIKERTDRDDWMVFECQEMMIDDPTVVAEAVGYVEKDHVNAECAVKRTAARLRAQFSRMNDPYFRERVRDIDDIERRYLKVLVGNEDNPHLELKTPSIVVADDLTPSETVRLPRELTLGFATNGGSATSHVALLARSLGIPAVMGLGDITEKVRPGERVLLDGNAGTVTLSPDDRAVAEFQTLVEKQRAVKEVVKERVPGTLKDGGIVDIFANFHPGAPTEGVKELGARGIGLYRSEYLWLNHELEPSEEEQFEAYKSAAEFAKSLSPIGTLTIRTLDIGGDKTVKGITVKEANPFLGNRSIRYLLSNRDVFRTQLRAILRASAFGKICILHPMVSAIEEIKEANLELEKVKRQLESEGVAFDRHIPVGIMVEVPSAALNAEAFAKYVDFFSIGTNDLVQYTMAADRANDAVAHLYQPLNPAVLKLMRMTIGSAKKAGIYVGVCGESAADPIVGVLWAAMGITLLSMSATYIPVISKILSHLKRKDLDDYATLAASADPGTPAGEMYSLCRGFLEERIPELDDILV